MAQNVITITVHVPRWVRPYVALCALLHRCGVPIDVERLRDQLVRAVKIR